MRFSFEKTPVVLFCGVLLVALGGLGADCGDSSSEGGAGAAGSEAGSSGTGGSSAGSSGSGGSSTAGSGGSTAGTGGSTAGSGSDAGAGGSGEAGSGQAGTGGDTEPAAVAGILAAHNKARAEVSPAADPPLAPMTWDASVAATAQGWADGCVFEHNPALQGLGENIYADAGQGDAKAVVADWVSEVANYDYATNSCSATCGHYTQVVWRDSTKLGCAKKDCSTNSPFGADFPNWTLWVCDYSPAGNTPDKPY